MDHLVLIGASHLEKLPGKAVSTASVSETLHQLRGISVPVNTSVGLDLFRSAARA
jgi:hypothetical protein